MDGLEDDIFSSCDGLVSGARLLLGCFRECTLFRIFPNILLLVWWNPLPAGFVAMSQSAPEATRTALQLLGRAPPKNKMCIYIYMDLDLFKCLNPQSMWRICLVHLNTGGKWSCSSPLTKLSSRYSHKELSTTANSITMQGKPKWYLALNKHLICWCLDFPSLFW